MTETVSYLGLRMLATGMAGVRDALDNAVLCGEYGYLVTPNVDHVVQYHEGKPDLVAAYDGAMFQVCDSRILAKIAALQGVKLVPCPGSDLTLSLLREPLPNAARIAVIGPDRDAFDLLAARFPHSKLTFIGSPARVAVGSPEWVDMVKRTTQAQWDLLFVCLSFPKQEFFAQAIAENGRQGGVALCIGASIDFLTDRQKRAPAWMQTMHMEWLYRLLSDPKRMFERYVVRGPAIFKLAMSSQAKEKPATAQASSQPRILFLSTVQPHMKQGGGEICTSNFIDGLEAAGVHVDVVAYERQGSASSLPANRYSPRQLLIESAQSRLSSAVWMAKALMSSRPYSVQKYVTPQMTAMVAQKLRERHYDLVVIDHIQAGWLEGQIPAKVPVLHIAHNVEHALYGSYGEQAVAGLKGRAKALIYRREAGLLRKLEQSVLARARQTWALSESDAAAYREQFPEADIRVFDIPGAKPDTDITEAVEPEVDVGLLGNWAWDINRAGLDWFVEKVAPLLPDNTDIVVAGRSLHQPGTRIGNVRFIGFAPHAGRFLLESRVVVVPTTVGSGVQVKTIETLALGMPSVVTRMAMRGIADPPATVTIVDDAQAMAAAIIDRLKTGSADMQGGRRWWARRNVSFETAIAAALTGILPSAQQADREPDYPLAAE